MMDPQPNVKGCKRKHFRFHMQNKTCAGKHLSNISRDGDVCIGDACIVIPIYAIQIVGSCRMENQFNLSVVYNNSKHDTYNCTHTVVI